MNGQRNEARGTRRSVLGAGMYGGHPRCRDLLRRDGPPRTGDVWLPRRGGHRLPALRDEPFRSPGIDAPQPGSSHPSTRRPWLALLEREQEQLAFRGIPVRLAALLLRETDAFGTVSGRSRQDFAERLGTCRETVSQTLGRFRSEEPVAVEPKRIRLLDPEGLRAYAEG